MQKDTERLVWQKKPIDGFLFYTTLALLAVGFVIVDYELYTKMLYPAKKNWASWASELSRIGTLAINKGIAAVVRVLLITSHC